MPTATITRSSMPPVRAWLQISIAVLLAMSGTIFACAEWSPLAAATIPVAAIGLLFVDRRPLIHIDGLSGNVLAILAVLASGYEFFGESLLSRLLAFGHLLVYLSWILLLQEKQTRQFWWLCALSVLQVATSAVLTTSPWLGLSLIVYVTFALWTLSLFSLYRAAVRAVGVEVVARPAEDASVDQRSRSRNAVRLESAARWMTPRFVGGVVVNVVLSMLLGLTIFVVTPRIWVSSVGVMAGEGLPASRAVSGFREEVKLGDLGEILENPGLVMEVRYFDNTTERPITVEQFLARVGFDAPFYRGAVLDAYEDGRWSRIESTDTHRADWRILDSGQQLYRLDVRLLSSGTNTVFSPPRGVTCLSSDRFHSIEHESLRDTFHRTSLLDSSPTEAFEYSAFALDVEHELRRRTNYLSQRRYRERQLAVPRGLEPVTRLAARIAGTSSSSTGPLAPAETAARMVSHFRDSGEYTYTTDLSIDDPSIDPVADFLVNRKRGHCEYFASALTLLLRAAGIPARYVSGYKGGAYNEKTRYYEVRQLHAHAWVEAYVDDEWIVLDPTPADRDLTVNATASSSHFWSDLIDQAKQLWDRAMLYSASQQKQLLLRPFQDSAGTLVQSFTDFTQLYTEGVYGVDSGRGNDNVLWRVFGSLLALASLLICGYAAFSVVSRGGGRFNRLRKKGGPAVGPLVPFYERFRAILARNGIVRGAAQTQREFAAALQSRRLRNGASAVLGDFPQLLTTAFYRIRFGQHVLAPGDLEHIETSLDRLEQSLSNGAPGNGESPR